MRGWMQQLIEVIVEMLATPWWALKDILLDRL
jgi:hypothetical protein